jgi:hypothetical protein
MSGKLRFWLTPNSTECGADKRRKTRIALACSLVLNPAGCGAGGGGTGGEGPNPLRVRIEFSARANHTAQANIIECFSYMEKL